MHEIILGYQGEMSLKGLNRNQFESAMMKILRYRLKTVGKFKVYCTQSTFYMEPEEEDVDMDLAFDRVSKVFGLASLSRAVVCDKDFDTICQTAEEYLGASLHGIRTFKVEARRADKTYRGHQRPRPEYAVRRHRQPGGSLPHGKARSGPGPHSFCVPSVYFGACKTQS